MAENSRPPGKTTIAPDVLLNIARLTALKVPGVNRLSPLPSSMDRIFKKAPAEGVRLTVEENIVYVDLYLVLNSDVNVREVAHTVQAKISRAISEMVGMEVGRVNVHVEDIEYSFTPES
jgi:uncharacterized alkaline shock family protein YloU